MLDAHLNTSAAVCHHDKTPRNVEAQAISPLPTHAMHVATRLIHLYLMYPRTICASSLRLYLPGVSFACSGSWQVTKPLGIRGILTSSLQCQMPPSGEPGRGLPVAGDEDAGMLADLVSVESVQCLASA